MSRKRKGYLLSVFIILMVASLLTNPTKQDYIHFDEKQTGVPIPDNVRVERVNFYLFSLYAAAHMQTIDEYGIVHLGFMGHFFQVTGGQYDDSLWKDFFKR